jgi:hypothetical protein
MNIVMVTTNDPAGTAIEFTKALNRYTPHRCRLVTTEIRYNFMYEKDLHVPWLRDFAELEHTLRGADVFHFHMLADEHLPLGPFQVRDFLRGHPVVHHHHGEPAFRAEPRRFAEREKALGRRALVSTPDLHRLYPEAEWLPNLVPLDDPAYVPKTEYNHRHEIIVGHSPTKKELKNTAEFRDVMARAMRRHPRLRERVIENTAHRECLKLKRDCDLFFDHMQGYYGVSSLEALGQGVPTIAGLDDWNLGHIRDFAGRWDVPWIPAKNAAELERRIEEFAADVGLRETRGRFSRAWMESAWYPEKIARRLAAFYETL